MAKESETAWTVFKLNWDCKQRPNCNCCGYFWGPAHKKHGQRCDKQSEEKHDVVGTVH